MPSLLSNLMSGAASSTRVSGQGGTAAASAAASGLDLSARTAGRVGRTAAGLDGDQGGAGGRSIGEAHGSRRRRWGAATLSDTGHVSQTLEHDILRSQALLDPEFLADLTHKPGLRNALQLSAGEPSIDAESVSRSELSSNTSMDRGGAMARPRRIPYCPALTL